MKTAYHIVSSGAARPISGSVMAAQPNWNRFREHSSPRVISWSTPGFSCQEKPYCQGHVVWQHTHWSCCWEQEEASSTFVRKANCCLCWDTRTQRTRWWGAPAFATSGWAASHHCRSPKPRGTWLLNNVVPSQFAQCLYTFNAARPGQRFIGIWADPFGSKVTKAASSSHWSIPFLKHDDLEDV